MILKSIRVVTFNVNEARAVDALLGELAGGASPWTFFQDRTIRRESAGDTWHIEHVALGAQGNVMSASALANFLSQDGGSPLSVLVFYGCAGAPQTADLRSVFIARDASYVSLGKVTNEHGLERAKVANKWLTQVSDDAVAPLRTVRLSSRVGPGAAELIKLLPCSPAHIAATDKVIATAVDAPPIPGPGGSFAKTQWTYGQSIAFVIDTHPDETVLIDMESYGIATMAEALGVADRVAIMRVTTDSLDNHSNSDEDQADWLMDGRLVLGALLHVILTGRTP